MVGSVVLLVCCASVRLWAQAPEASTAASIRALEREWAEAQSHNNNNLLDLIMDNAIVYVEYGRLVSKGDYLSRIRQQNAGLDDVVMGPMQLRNFGSTVIVVGTYTETQRRQGTRRTMSWRFVDTWTYKERGWVLIAAGSTRIS